MEPAPDLVVVVTGASRGLGRATALGRTVAERVRPRAASLASPRR